MKTTNGRVLKRIVSTLLVTTLTLSTVYMAYTQNGSNSNVVETKKTEESSVVQVEDIVLEHDDSAETQEIVVIDDTDTTYEDTDVSTIVTEENIISETVVLPEIMEDEKTGQETDIADAFDEVKKNEIYLLSAGVSDETENDILQWTDRNDICSVDVYARYVLLGQM